MTARRVALLAAIVTMGAAGWYVFLYLTRWEWNRAVVAGVIFLAAELALVGSLVLDRLAKIERRQAGQAGAAMGAAGTVSGGPSRRAPQPGRSVGAAWDASGEPADHGAPDPRVRARLNGSAPSPREPFAWLRRESGRLSVFVPILLGAGVVLSGAAWVVERLARFTAGPALERTLARRLDALALPPGGLLGDDGAPHDPFSPWVDG